ncbi:helicase SKI2W [Cephus cinctus]|uniref:Helicase SKI2W n=1 Tax=Cephus cinctus TaxID=211228 RepID=A0AAJ7FEB7_CEPCN|nr:helicase SKI2W [Cephus cinctus]
MSVSKGKYNIEMPFGPPPILSDIKSEIRAYITCPERLPIHQIDNVQCYWPREPDILQLLHSDLAPVGMTLRFDRDPITGSIKDMKEVPLQGAGETARNSMSMSRAPGPPKEGVRGSASNCIFWPGGFEELEPTKNNMTSDIDFENNLRTLAKGFSAGIEFKSDNCTPKDKEIEKAASPTLDSKESEVESEEVNLLAMVHEQKNLIGLWSTPSETKKEETIKNDMEIDLTKLDDVTDVQTKPDVSVLKITSTGTSLKTEMEWAEMLDVSIPVANFEEKVPDLAFKYDYELDTFQKQAVIKLEEGCNVFVAAHTSAGKTTVAEYAIALSQRHMTRTIYTSPIKALSNQKYRDFKNKFDSVGLITGDFQINQTASCLIMTTEILQSMLYCASEVLRDLEYVIFDEVHYINNEDRGHVWEEVVILLPPTVNIVMLSATVPNPLVFANWVGQIKKRKMYVISTLKRPVPLQHFLYTGTNKKTKNERFLILDSKGDFLMDGYNAAKAAKDAAEEKKGPYGPDTRRSTKPIMDKKDRNPQNKEKTTWLAFIDHLRSENNLPVVAFTLSRNRCDKNAEALESIDLTTKNEKESINTFFTRCIKRLKPSDTMLPQVRKMQMYLSKGIGVHHSGILPILKEIVEILFQTGVVKLLFATETFAMGVNMPARTVVFDSVRKYDGTGFRTLYPAEYIQMAGRAGRRGLDPTGTVIIMCKSGIPSPLELKNMMCGEPKNLESQFRVTYSMILNLRRISEAVTVEGMMRRSFKESKLISKQQKFKKDLNEIEKQLADLPEFNDLQKQIAEFYTVAKEYIQELKPLKPRMFTMKKPSKALTVGRILIISHMHHYNKLALLLRIVPKGVDLQYKVLVLDNSEETPSSDDIQLETPDSKPESNLKSINFYKMIALTKKELFVPEGVASHQVLQIPPDDILEITNCTMKVDSNLIISDWERRQIPRFKDTPPGPTCQAAIQELTTISLNAVANPEILLPYTNMSVNDHELLTNMTYLENLKKKLSNFKYGDIVNFEEQFELVFMRKELEDRRAKLQFALSDESLTFYPDYKNRVEVLRHLRYIDQDERVALKGRVALEMGTHELLITELVFRNVLTVLPPAEIAALLSALVYQQRSNEQLKLPSHLDSLQKSCEALTEVYDAIVSVEKEFGVDPTEPLNFNLVEVVYEWAREKPFTKIMELTDVQEGIIVRCIQQLNETLRDVKNAAIIIGDPVLKEKMEEASTAIKRDIVFAASLYTQE